MAIEAIAIANNDTKVIVFIPPAVPTGEPPINIKIIVNSLPLGKNSFKSVKVILSGGDYLSDELRDKEKIIPYLKQFVKEGNAIVNENLEYSCKNYSCKNTNITINVNNLNYQDSISLKISNVYNEKNPLCFHCSSCPSSNRLPEANRGTSVCHSNRTQILR